MEDKRTRIVGGKSPVKMYGPTKWVPFSYQHPIIKDKIVETQRLEVDYDAEPRALFKITK